MIHKLRVLLAQKEYLSKKINTKRKVFEEKGFKYVLQYDPLYTKLKHCLLDICILTEERFCCCSFSENGYKVLDKLNYNIVFYGKDKTGEDAKKWVFIENKKFLTQLNSMPDMYMYMFGM